MPFRRGACLLAIACGVRAFAACPEPLEVSNPQILGVVETESIVEGSGLAVSQRNAGVLWTHNDGSKNDLYAISTSGALLARFDLGKNVNDFEDIAVGPGPQAGLTYVYAGDIGSNNGSREKVRILRVIEPVVDPNWAPNPPDIELSNVDVCSLEYPDGSYDAEALLLDPIDRHIYVVTKERGKGQLFRASLDALEGGETIVLEYVTDVFQDEISGGSISPDGRLIAVRNEYAGQLWVRRAGESLKETVERISFWLPLVAPPEEPNGEGIALANGGFYTFSEGEAQPLYYFQITENNPAPRFVGAPARAGAGWRFLVETCSPGTVVLERTTDTFRWTEAGRTVINAGSGVVVDPENRDRAFYRIRLIPE